MNSLFFVEHLPEVAKTIISNAYNQKIVFSVLDKPDIPVPIHIHYIDATNCEIVMNNELSDEETSLVIELLKQVAVKYVYLETPRLIIRPLKMADLPDYFLYSVQENVMDSAGDKTLSTMEEAKKELSKYIRTGYTYAIILKETNKFIGSIVFYRNNLDKFELGFSINENYHRNGYAYEATKSLIDFVTKKIHITEIFSRHFYGNTASEHLLLKLGFHFQKYSINSFFHLGRNAYVDTLDYIYKDKTNSLT